VKILVTGAAGFIGYHVSQSLLESGHEVVGLDNLNNYYDVALKQSRLDLLLTRKGFNFFKLDLVNREEIEKIFKTQRFERVVHLAAQAGVRYSIQNPHVYVDSNVTGFLNILEGCRNNQVEHLVYASTSSVYGNHKDMPFSEHKGVDHPISIYAATKKANELMAHSYSHLFGLPTTGLRFFTVYGPWGRPDMALFLFTKAVFDGKPIDVFNQGNMVRDFTFVDDIVKGIVGVLERVPGKSKKWDSNHPDPSFSEAPYKIYNIGNSDPVPLMRFIQAIEKSIGKKAQLNLLPMQEGDVPATHADVSDLMRDVGFRPATPVEVGVEKFIAWYREYFKV